ISARTENRLQNFINPPGRRLWSSSNCLEVLFAAAYAQLLHSRFQSRWFEAEHFRGTPSPPHSPVSRLQHFAKILGIDFIEPSQICLPIFQSIRKFGAENGIAIQDQVAFDYVTKLSHITRPEVLLKLSHRRGVYAFDAITHALCEIVQDVAGYGRNILPALPQGRKNNRKNIQPIEKKFPEISFFFQRLQVSVCCGHDPPIHPPSFI